MIYFGLYLVVAAIYSLYATWSWTTYPDRLKKLRVEYECKTGIKVDPKLLTCFVIVWDTITWPIGILIVLYVHLKFALINHKLKEKKHGTQ